MTNLVWALSFCIVLTDTSAVVEKNEREKNLINTVEFLETEGHVKARQLDKKEVTKPVKKRPKSEGYELFEREPYVIGVVSVLPSLPNGIAANKSYWLDNDKPKFFHFRIIYVQHSELIGRMFFHKKKIIPSLAVGKS